MVLSLWWLSFSANKVLAATCTCHLRLVSLPSHFSSPTLLLTSPSPVEPPGERQHIIGSCRQTMDPRSQGSSDASTTTPTRNRPSARRTPSELSALSKSILSLHDDPDCSQESRHSDGASDRSHPRQRRSKRERERDRGNNASFDRASAPLLTESARTTSSSSSQSIDAGHYSDSFSGSSSLIYNESFMDHQPLQRQLQTHGQVSPQMTSSHRTARPISSSRDRSFMSTSSISRPQHPGASYMNGSTSASLFDASARSESTSPQISRRNTRQSKQTDSGESSPQRSAHSSGSELNKEMAEDTLIMPQLTMVDQAHHNTSAKPAGDRNSLATRSSVLRAEETMGPLPRIMTPSPVPLHARLSRLQKEAKKGARVLDMDNQGASHHYDYEDVTDSSYDFSSRRHSVAEEDVMIDLYCDILRAICL